MKAGRTTNATGKKGDGGMTDEQRMVRNTGRDLTGHYAFGPQ